MPTEKVGAVLCSSCELPGMMQPKGAVTSQGLQLPRAPAVEQSHLPLSSCPLAHQPSLP